MAKIQFNRTIAYRNRNPLNIRYNKNIKWFGQTGQEGGFCKFQNFTLGYRAAMLILRSYRQRGITTLGDIIRRWAPPTENKTEQYINAICNGIGARYSQPFEVSPQTEIDLKNRELVIDVLLHMTRVEMGANAAQLHDLRPSMERGYELAVTEKNFFNGI